MDKHTARRDERRPNKQRGAPRRSADLAQDDTAREPRRPPADLERSTERLEMLLGH